MGSTWRSHSTLPKGHSDLWDRYGFSAVKRRWNNVGLMLGQRRRWWTNIKPTLGKHLLFKWRSLWPLKNTLFDIKDTTTSNKYNTASGHPKKELSMVDDEIEGIIYGRDVKQNHSENMTEIMHNVLACDEYRLIFFIMELNLISKWDSHL